MSTTPEDLATRLLAAAETVAAYGSTGVVFGALTGEALISAQKDVCELREVAGLYGSFVAAAIAKQSDPALGNAGLAATHGFISPVAMIQNLTGADRKEATKLVAVGTMLTETDAAESHNLAAHDNAATQGADSSAPDAPAPFLVRVPWQAPIAHAVRDGVLSIDQAEAIRRGLGDVDVAVTGDTLTTALTDLIPTVAGMTAEHGYREARRSRDRLDAAGVAAREKQALDDEYLRVFRRPDGMVVINGLLAPENGEFIASVFDAVTSPRRGGVRFVDPAKAAWAARLEGDPRTTGQIAADSFTQLLRVGVDADPGTICGGKRPAVRVVVPEHVLIERTGYGYLEGNPIPVSFQSVERAVCDTGVVGVLFDQNADCVNVGREQRLFTPRQRVGIAVRDGGCRWPGCDRPVSWTEAHHIEHWHRDHGATDIASGICLCRRHHMLLHNNGWQINRNSGDYLLTPPVTVDPNQTPIEMPSKSPLMQNLFPGTSRHKNVA